MSSSIDTSTTSYLGVPAPLSGEGASPREGAPAAAARAFAQVLAGPGVAVAGALGGPLAALGVSGASALMGGMTNRMAASADPVAAMGGRAAAEDSQTLGDLQQLQAQGQEMNLEYLGVQEQMQADDRSFSTLSNLLKAEHDTAKAAIENIRS